EEARRPPRHPEHDGRRERQEEQPDAETRKEAEGQERTRDRPGSEPFPPAPRRGCLLLLPDDDGRNEHQWVEEHHRLMRDERREPTAEGPRRGASEERGQAVRLVLVE